METFLNLVWAALAVAMICAWLHVESGTHRRRQLIAILMLIAILLPAISISDDLMAMQNATETDTSVRRSQLLTAGAHTPSAPASKILVASVFEGLVIVRTGYAPPLQKVLPRFEFCGLQVVQNRPPPSA